LYGWSISAAPDPTFVFVGGPSCPTLDFVIAFWITIAFYTLLTSLFWSITCLLDYDCVLYIVNFAILDYDCVLYIVNFTILDYDCVLYIVNFAILDYDCVL
jgi:hypothetical protein